MYPVVTSVTAYAPRLSRSMPLLILVIACTGDAVLLIEDAFQEGAMPRNSAKKYTAAYKAITDATKKLQVDEHQVSRVMIDAVNANRIRIRGLIHEPVEVSAEGALEYHSLLERLRPTCLARNKLGKNLFVKPTLNGKAIKWPSLCAQGSIIQLSSTPNGKTSLVISQAGLLTSDTNRVLHDRFNIPAHGVGLGVRRTDRLWGDVIMHLLELERRGSLRSGRSPTELVKSVLNAVPDANEPSIRPVLNYVAKRLERLGPKRAL